MRKKIEARDRANPIRVFVSATERTELTLRAELTGMTVSAFLRAAGQGLKVRNVLDLKAIVTLAEVNREQAALAALFRQSGAGGMDAKQVVRQIVIVQAKLVEAAQKVRT